MCHNWEVYYEIMTECDRYPSLSKRRAGEKRREALNQVKNALYSGPMVKNSMEWGVVRLIFSKLATAGNPCSYVSPTCVVLMRYTLMMGFEHRRVGMEVTWGKAVHHCFVGTTRWPTQADTLDLGILKVTKKSCLVEKSSCFPTRNQPLFVEVGRSHSL